MTLHANMTMPDLQRCSFFCEYLHCFYKTRRQMKINLKKKYKYPINTWSDKLFKDTVLNRALTSLHEVSLKLTLTVSYNVYMRGHPSKFEANRSRGFRVMIGQTNRQPKIAMPDLQRYETLIWTKLWKKLSFLWLE